MDDFLAAYFFIAIVAIVAFVLFWGVVIYLAVRFFRSNNGLNKAQKLDLLTKLMQAYSGRSGASGGPMDTRAGDVAASQGIDLNDGR